MELYLLRHGIAEDSAPGGRDADRELTAEGKKKLRHLFKIAEEADVRPKVILSSPYRRAQQTAALAAKHLGFGGEVSETRVLVPEANPAEAWEEVRLYKGEESVMLVTHEPFVSRMAAYLLNSPSLLVDFKKGAMMRIDCESMGAQPHGVLRWYLTSRIAA